MIIQLYFNLSSVTKTSFVVMREEKGKEPLVQSKVVLLWSNFTLGYVQVETVCFKLECTVSRFVKTEKYTSFR